MTVFKFALDLDTSQSYDRFSLVSQHRFAFNVRM